MSRNAEPVTLPTEPVPDTPVNATLIKLVYTTVPTEPVPKTRVNAIELFGLTVPTEPVPLTRVNAMTIDRTPGSAEIGADDNGSNPNTV